MSTNSAYPSQATGGMVVEDENSLDYQTNVAVAQKVGAVETAEYLRRRLGDVRLGDLRSVLDKVPNNPPLPRDEVPGDLEARFGTLHA